MKKRFWKYLLLCVVLVNGLSSLAWAANLQKYTLAQENEFLRLYVQEETAEFAIEDIESGEVWFSTPQTSIWNGSNGVMPATLCVLWSTSTTSPQPGRANP